MSASKLTKTRVQQLLASGTVAQAARELNVGYHALYRYMQVEGIRTPKSKYHSIKHLIGTRPLKEIAEDYDLSFESLRNYCHRSGISVKVNDATKFPEADLKLAAELVEAGLTMEVAARKMEIRYGYFKDWYNAQK